MGITMPFLSVMKNAVTKMAKVPETPVIRNAHPVPRWSMVQPVAKEKTKPPMPDPAALIPLARLLLFTNHWERTAMLGTYAKPTPKPTSTPWER